MALPRMRTVKEAMDTIKEADPHTALSEHVDYSQESRHKKVKTLRKKGLHLWWN